MKFPELSLISEKKITALKAQIEAIGLNLSDVEETFVKGSGKGGQKVNKTSNAVKLKHLPTGLTVTCQRERERSLNRFIALRELVEKLSPEKSAAELKAEKIRKQKKRRKRKQAESD